jgi:GNAT superfamily N-acetyltransferase
VGEAVTLRRMTPAEYAAYTAAREAEVTRVLSDLVPAEEANARALQGTAQHLPDGLDTRGHDLVIAENAAGEVVGNAWLGPDPHRPESGDAMWLYDINVHPEVRGRGYGSGLLRAVEELAARHGADRLGLNVFGSNPTAIALYERGGYTVTTLQMSKRLGP